MPPRSTRKIRWYRSPVPRDQLAALNKRSDLMGLAQTLGYLATLAATGSAAVWAGHRLPAPWVFLVTPVLLLIHGAGWAFLINGFHELVHDSVFKTRLLNRLFLLIFSFLGWHNHVWFWASHTEHHKYTLHPPDDLEVTLPQHHRLGWRFWVDGLFNPRWLRHTLKSTWRTATGKLDDRWSRQLFANDPANHRRLKNWARTLLVGHGLIVGVSIYFGWYMLPWVVSFAPMFGALLHRLCNSTQHAGLVDNVPDYRLCCRTIYLNPVFQFLYWHMNYHTEHHMYAAVPCYNLPRLHRLIKHDLPAPPAGLRATWRQILSIQRRQQDEPSYQYVQPLPATANPPRLDPVGDRSAQRTDEAAA